MPERHDALPADLAAVASCAHPDPHAVLGARAHRGGMLVRVLKPGASGVAVRTADAVHPLDAAPPAASGRGTTGIFCGVVPLPHRHARGRLPDYRLVVTYPPGRAYVMPDGYRMPPTVRAADLAAFEAGTHRRLWEVLGARPTMMGTPTGAVSGTAFAVWAPHARAVAVIGDFDGWSGPGAPMRRLGSSGVWEVFIPGVGPGELYKFRIRGADGVLSDRADPMAGWAETPPKTASRVAADRHVWTDAAWLARRAAADPRRAPMSTYEVHPGSWNPGLDYAGLAAELVPYVAELGFTHVELMPVAEHPYGASWGYQVTSQFAPTARLGDPDGLRELVDTFHAAGIGVLLDWVPAHFPRDGWALARFDGAPLYEPDDRLRADHPDWGTLTFDLTRPQVRAFLLSSALYWIERFHVDGLRVDAVASMLYRDYSRDAGQWRPHPEGGREDLDAVAFLRELTATVAQAHPGVAVIAEDSSLRPGTTAPPASGGLGFTFRWHLGWMHHALARLARDPAAGPSRMLAGAREDCHVLPISHDEVVHGKGTPWHRTPGPPDVRAADLRAMLAAMWAHPGKKLLFMGQEYAQETEWSDLFGPDWAQMRAPVHGGVHDLVARLNTLYRALPALWLGDCSAVHGPHADDGALDAGALDAGAADADAFIRTAAGHRSVACLTNLSDAPRRTPLRTGPGTCWRIALDTGEYTGRRTGESTGAQKIRTVRPTIVTGPGTGADPRIGPEAGAGTVTTAATVPAHSSVWLIADAVKPRPARGRIGGAR